MEINNVNKLYYVNNNLTQESSDVTKVVTEVSLIDSNTAVDELVLSLNTVTPNSNITSVEPVVYEVTTETPLNTQSIKEILYKLHHPAEGFVAGGNTQSGEIGDAWDIIQHINRESDSTVNVNTGVSRAQLLKVTQKDAWEESNSNFFGSINHSFDKLDGNGDGVLQFTELQNFAGYQFGSTISIFSTKVNNYAAQIQSEYEACGTLTAKMNFAIDKAKDYLTAMGMTDQLDALERLQNENKIGFKDCNPGETLTTGVSWTLGSYNHLGSGGMYITDDITDKYDYENGDGIPDLYTDGGLFLDETYYNQSSIKWYELTSTLIHELTHATAYLYSDYPYAESSALSGYVGLSDDAIYKLWNAGALSDGEYSNYKAKHESGTLTKSEYLMLAEMTEVMWGEYIAYQNDEDYEDSIARGDYAGMYEHIEIEDHIDAYYVDEPEPDNDWWITYYKNNQISYNA